MNMYGQVSILGHQMSLAGGDKAEAHDSEVPRGGGGRAGGVMFSEVQCILGNDHMGTAPLTSLDRMTDRQDKKHYLPTTSQHKHNGNSIIQFRRVSFTRTVYGRNSDQTRRRGFDLLCGRSDSQFCCLFWFMDRESLITPKYVTKYIMSVMSLQNLNRTIRLSFQYKDISVYKRSCF